MAQITYLFSIKKLSLFTKSKPRTLDTAHHLFLCVRPFVFTSSKTPFLRNSSHFLPLLPYTMQKRTTFFSLLLFSLCLFSESPVCCRSQPQLSSPLYGSHIYFFSLPQISGYLNSMKVSFSPSSFRQVASKGVGAAKTSAKKSILSWTLGKNILELLLYLFFHLILS